MRHMEEKRAYCIHCNGEIGIVRIISADGVKFCSEDCYETHWEMERGLSNNAVADSEHPYYDDYRLIRLKYIDLMGSDWRKQLQDAHDAGEIAQFIADQMIEDIDSTIIQCADYYRDEGADGSFAREIYNYLIDMEDIQREMFQWRPQYKSHYIIKVGECNESDWAELIDELDIIGGEINHNWDHQLVFDEEENYKKARQQLDENYISREAAQEVTGGEAYRCPWCDYALEPYEYYDKETGWFYCSTCKDDFDLGQFHAEETRRIIQYYADNPDSLLRENSTEDTLERFRRKIRRSCVQYGIPLPLWADPFYLNS